MRTTAITLWACLWAAPLAAGLDLTKAQVVAPNNLSRHESKAVAVLVEEIEKRSTVRLPVTASATGAHILLSRRPGGPAEGYCIAVRGETVELAANDARGLLFGIGRLLREMQFAPGNIQLADTFAITTAPHYRLRGHQLGYRPKTNSYDGWTVPMWDQYIRELALFGTNAIELIPPRSDDAPTSPHFPLPPLPMMIEMAKLIDSYGLDVWIWYPALDKDYADPHTVEFARREWGEVFRQLPRIDAVLVPGGDPGHTQPKYLLSLLEGQTAVLHRTHPQAQMWVSPQGFNQEWMDEFLALLKQEPAWLTGVAYGPEVRISIDALRRAVPARYPIRNYPDITHSTYAQFVVPDWDLAHKLTHYREPINPRPNDMAAIFRHEQPATIGFITYSEGCNDDLNKFVWSALGWDPQADVSHVVQEYARLFLGSRQADAFAQGLLALERNWQGPLLTNAGVFTTLAQFQAMEQHATPHELQNWRLQMALYRAYYDALNRRRLLHDTAAEEAALDALRAAPATGAGVAVEQAQQALDHAAAQAVAPQWRSRVFELATALFQSIHMQLSVPRFQAIGRERGATLDNVDIPFNNRSWLTQQLASVRRLATEPDRQQALERIVNWTNPGPGGFYDDLGNPAQQPHLVQSVAYADDPGHLRHPLMGMARPPWNLEGWRMSWITDAESMFDAPVELHYPHLDRTARYRVRVIYGGEKSPYRVIRLTANNQYEVHPFRKIENLTEPLEFDIPPAATAGGELRLTWVKTSGLPGAGRGCQVAEVWLIRQ